MLSRKNYKETIRKQTPTKQHYTIKKLTVGVASVLIGLSFMGELEGDSVHADTMTAGSESTSVTSTTAQDGLKKSSQLYLQVTDTNNPSTPSSASSTGTIKNVTSSAAVQVKSASDEEDSDSTLAKGENKFAQSAVKDSVTDGKTSTAEINPAKLSSPALITQLNQSLAKSSTSDALKANDELEIKATDPTNYPNCGDVDGPLLELDSGQLVNKDEVISLKDMYIFQILKLVNTKDSDFKYVILTMNRKDTADRSIYLFGTGSNYSDATVFKAKPNDTYELGKSGYSFTYTEPTTINGHDVDGSSYVTGSTYYDDWHLKPQHLQIIYSLGNYNPNTDVISVGEIMPSYEKVPVIKYSGVPSNIISQPKVYIVGFTGQEFNVTDIINNYKKVLKGYYLQNPNVASMGTLSQFENGGYYLKTYYDNGNVDFKGLYHQIDDQGTMEVSVLNANNEIIARPEIIPAGGSYEFKFYNWFKYYNWIARNPYVTSSAHEVTLKYAKLGSVIPVDENGNKINDGWQYVNDPDDASKATSPYEKAPVIDGYVAVSPDETIVLPHNLSSDTKIYYRKSIKVTYSGSDSKTYDGNPANFDPTTVQWSGLAGLNTSTLTSADFTWN
ncbi:MAG: Lar_0958 family LPXTG-anchored mucus adhesin, partial [Limosilactobacillus reuteri]|nr:Lar_0958 family LPXTG-anchored mucus adhesin [Limosilactobacillus reuteri]